MEWVNKYISAFGGDPSNVTLFGEGTGATDILCHLNSIANERAPLFHRAIAQSMVLDLDIPNVSSAGWQLSKLMSSFRAQTVEEMRAIDVNRLVSLGLSIRATDDGFFFRKGWRDSIYPEEPDDCHLAAAAQVAATHRVVNGHLDVPELQALSQHSHHHHHHHHLHSASRSRSRTRSPHPKMHPHHDSNQPLIIGDCGAESMLWTLPASLWTPTGVVRRIRAVCQSLSKSNALLRAYDIGSNTPADELTERILELINDARFAWPIDRIAKTAKHERGGKNVWRYVFDQESPSRGIPHHAIDLMYLFDTVPVPSLSSIAAPPETFELSPEISRPGTPATPEMVYGSDSSSEDGRMSPDYGFDSVVDDDWGVPMVDEYSYSRVRDAIHSRWVAFAYGEAPWNDEKVFVFGPEGETGERSTSIFAGRRRTQMWKDAFDPLGLQVIQKVGMELSNGPTLSTKGGRYS